MSLDSILRINNLSIIVNKKQLFKNVSFGVEEGEIVLMSGENGIGKSTILKSILKLDTIDKNIKGEIFIHGFGNILELNRAEIQKLRSKIAYIQQRDDYVEMGKIQVRDIINESMNAHIGSSISYSEVNDLIDEWIPRKKDNSRVFDARSNPAKFSGGEQRLLSVFSVVATRALTELLVIDEPLNNLDFINAKNINNIINKSIKSNFNMGVLLISHCRIFPFITREIRLTSNGIQNVMGMYKYHSCLGIPNDEGYYI